MTTVRRFCCNDLLRFTSVHSHCNIETKFLSWYLSYIAVWPNYFNVAEAPGSRIMGYIISKVQGEEIEKHGYITNVAVAEEYRNVDLVKKFVDRLEDINEKIDKTYFMEVNVLASSTRGREMYERLGFELYRRVPCPEEEDRLQLRKELLGLVALKEFMASVQRAAAANAEILSYDSDSSWLSDDGGSFHSDDDGISVPSEDVTNVPSAGDSETTVPSEDVTNVPSEGDDMTNEPSAGDC